jgi:hypothetical protein
MDLFWPENESNIYILVSFQHMWRLEIAATIGMCAVTHIDCARVDIFDHYEITVS